MLRSARKIALDRNTSVNQIIRDYLSSLVNDSFSSRAALERFDELVRNSTAEVGPITWTREDLHDRSQG